MQPLLVHGHVGAWDVESLKALAPLFPKVLADLPPRSKLSACNSSWNLLRSCGAVVVPQARGHLAAGPVQNVSSGRNREKAKSMSPTAAPAPTGPEDHQAPGVPGWVFTPRGLWNHFTWPFFERKASPSPFSFPLLLPLCSPGLCPNPRMAQPSECLSNPKRKAPTSGLERAWGL